MGRAKMKRVVALGDLHCGHRVGLTPPEYQWHAPNTAKHAWQKYGDIQREAWNWYAAKVEELKPVDLLLVSGDCIDGRGERSGGVELITADRSEQVDMAVACLEPWNAKQVVIVRGTPYHAGQYEAWEDPIAMRLKAKIGNHEWVTVRCGKTQTTFDLKHYIGGSQILHGRATAVKRDEMWNAIWAEAGLQPRGDWILRGHVHYYGSNSRYSGDRKVTAMTLPALQGMGSRFGALKMSGTVDFGLVTWDITEEAVRCKEHIALLSSQKAQALLV